MTLTVERNMSFKEQLIINAMHGLAMGVGLGLVTLAVVGLVMLATAGDCKL